MIDDGRRFLRRSATTYDVITIDPPPPIEAAGSSLLDSREFYAIVRQRLNEGGLLHQWCPSDDPLDVAAIARSLVESFPHVRAWRSVEGWGLHFLAAMSPIEVPRAADLLARFPPAARRDLVEWNPGELRDPETFLTLVLGSERPIAELLHRDTDVAIDDDMPFTEYFLVRRFLLPLWER